MKTSGMGVLEAVLAVARHRNFRAAATELGVSTSALSHAVAGLESRIGVRLFNRTTRSVSLSEAGAQFVHSVAPALSTIRVAIEQAGRLRDTVSGVLRINTSAGAARQVMPLLIEFLQRYPEIRLDIVTEGRLIDIVADGFDAGIRLAETVPQDMIAVPFGDTQRFAVVGSPAYFARHKPPRTPGDLHAHQCMRVRMPSGAIYHWEFERHGEAVRIDAKGSLLVDEPGLMQQAARAGFGLAYLSEWSVTTDLQAGTLVRVLEEWTPPLDGLCLYYPGRRHVPAGLRALIDLIREHADSRRLRRERPSSQGKAPSVRR
jgi:DNA-binding transcriptional LysR family regulator